ATLAARASAAAPGASVGLEAEFQSLLKHARLDMRRTQGPRVRLPGDAELTREQVLAALATPQALLLEALEASAASLLADEWRAADPHARDILEATRAGAPSEEVNFVTWEGYSSVDKNQRWIQQHAPYHVRRLPNGGVLLATHPYRTLWPLWA